MHIFIYIFLLLQYKVKHTAIYCIPASWRNFNEDLIPLDLRYLAVKDLEEKPVFIYIFQCWAGNLAKSATHSR